MEKAKENENLTFTRYINHILKDEKVTVKNLEEDLRTGTILISLVEKLSKSSIGNYSNNPKLDTQKMDNFAILFKFLRNNLSININVEDYNVQNITQGVDSLVMLNELLWSIIYNLQVLPTLNKYNIGNSSLGYGERVSKFIDTDCRHFFQKFQEGSVFIKLFHKFYPEFIPDGSISSDMGSIFRILTRFSVPFLITAEEMEKNEIPVRSTILFTCIVIESFFIKDKGKLFKKELKNIDGRWVFDGRSYFADDIPLVNSSNDNKSKEDSDEDEDEDEDDYYDETGNENETGNEIETDNEYKKNIQNKVKNNNEKITECENEIEKEKELRDDGDDDEETSKNDDEDDSDDDYDETGNNISDTENERTKNNQLFTKEQNSNKNESNNEIDNNPKNSKKKKKEKREKKKRNKSKKNREKTKHKKKRLQISDDINTSSENLLTIDSSVEKGFNNLSDFANINLSNEYLNDKNLKNSNNSIDDNNKEDLESKKKTLQKLLKSIREEGELNDDSDESSCVTTETESESSYSDISSDTASSLNVTRSGPFIRSIFNEGDMELSMSGSIDKVPLGRCNFSEFEAEFHAGKSLSNDSKSNNDNANNNDDDNNANNNIKSSSNNANEKIANEIEEQNPPYQRKRRESIFSIVGIFNESPKDKDKDKEKEKEKEKDLKKQNTYDGRRKREISTSKSIFKLGRSTMPKSQSPTVTPDIEPIPNNNYNYIIKRKEDKRKNSSSSLTKKKSVSREKLILENEKMQTMLEDLIETNYQLEKEKKELHQYRKSSTNLLKNNQKMDSVIEEKDKKIKELTILLSEMKENEQELTQKNKLLEKKVGTAKEMIVQLQYEITVFQKKEELSNLSYNSNHFNNNYVNNNINNNNNNLSNSNNKKRKSRVHNTISKTPSDIENNQNNSSNNVNNTPNNNQINSNNNNSDTENELKGVVRIHLENNNFVSIPVDNSTTAIALKDILVKKSLKTAIEKAQKDALLEQYEKYVLIEENIIDSNVVILPIAKSHSEKSRIVFRDPNSNITSVNVNSIMPAETDKYTRSNDTIVTLLTSRIQSLEQEAEGLRTQLEKQKLKSKGKRKLAVDVSKIQVNEKLAEVGGSFAQVYSATVDGWVCAMKELNMQDCSDFEGFEREVALFEVLPAHPNIVRYLYHEKVFPKLRLFMQKYGGTLGDFLKRKKDQLTKNGEETVNYFSLVEIQGYLLDISNGLCFLHSHGVIHRDMKSDNIFYTVNGNKEIHRLAVGDFDTAKTMRGATYCKTIVGTPSFIAPEVLRAKEGPGYNYKADVYSFGMIIYELLSLKQPYDGCSILEVSSKILSGERPVLPDGMNDSYAPFIDLFLKCTELNPEERPDINAVFETLSKLPFLASVSGHLYT